VPPTPYETPLVSRTHHVPAHVCSLQEPQLKSTERTHDTGGMGAKILRALTEPNLGECGPSSTRWHNLNGKKKRQNMLILIYCQTFEATEESGEFPLLSRSGHADSYSPQEICYPSRHIRNVRLYLVADIPMNGLPNTDWYKKKKIFLLPYIACTHRFLRNRVAPC
jgi:hypothetical protein